MKIIRVLTSFALISFSVTGSPIVLETPAFRYVITETGTNSSFKDRAGDREYLQNREGSPCAWLQLAGKKQPSTEASVVGDRLTLQFGDTGISVVLKTDRYPTHLVLTVESIKGGDVEALTFLNVPLTLKGSPDEPFGACALSLNLFTRVDALPVLQKELRASCEKKFGMIGAKAGIAAAPMKEILPTLQQTLVESSELPICKSAGPWARESPIAHGSYLFNFGTLVESNVDEWISMTRNVGFTQIDNHGGSTEFFRFGDMELNRKKWPEGWGTYKRIVSKLHDAGISSIFHTYAFFIDKQSKYVAPVPDPRLDAFRTFTLAEPVTEDATEIVVNEPTSEMRTVTGFMEQNSIVLHIDDELVTFGGASKEAPWKFTGVKRGAHGTKVAAHSRGTKARHLKELFGLFVPNVETTLFEEIADNHARVVNECGFDGIYLDAIDGSRILRGADELWYWSQKFVVEIQKRLQQPVGMEMSAMAHHFWQYRTRWQAWDYPSRGHTRFIDLHAEAVNGGLLLPLHLGWWTLQSFDPPQVEPTYPDVMEHLGARLIGWDAGVSLTASLSPGALRTTPLFRRAADILRTCEEMRQAGVFDEAAKAKLREPGGEYALFKDAKRWRFCRALSTTQVVAPSEPWTLQWRATNGFKEQPARFRIEALMAVPLNLTNRELIAKLAAEQSDGWKPTTAAGVRLLSKPVDHLGDGGCLLTATNTDQVARKAAWARLTKRFDPTLNLKELPALAVEIEGDGSGVVVAIRLESPHHLAYGAIADRYITVDFTGRRAFTLLETESSRWSDYVWNDGKHPYNVYRETIRFDAIESVSVWLQNLPPGRETKIGIGPIHALPMVSAVVRNPAITLSGKTVEFPVELKSGSWIECNGADDCLAYGPKGEPLGKLVPRGDWPTLKQGVNEIQFSCDTKGDPQPRARIVTRTFGETL